MLAWNRSAKERAQSNAFIDNSEKSLGTKILRIRSLAACFGFKPRSPAISQRQPVLPPAEHLRESCRRITLRLHLRCAARELLDPFQKLLMKPTNGVEFIESKA